MLLLVAVGVLLGVSGARTAWATVTATADVGQLGQGVVGEAQVTGDDLAAVSGISLLGLVAGAGIAATRGRGRWVVGIALAACGVLLIVTAQTERADAAETALDRAATGRLESVPATASLEVTTSPVGAILATAGGLSLVAAAAETFRRGRAWPSLGAAFRAPGDRPGDHRDDRAPGGRPSDATRNGDGGEGAPGTPDDEEPPWQGD